MNSNTIIYLCTTNRINTFRHNYTHDVGDKLCLFAKKPISGELIRWLIIFIVLQCIVIHLGIYFIRTLAKPAPLHITRPPHDNIKPHDLFKA